MTPEAKPVYYDCEICGYFHPINWNGDCRDDANRFSYDQLDAKHGVNGYEILTLEEFEARAWPR